MTRLSIRGFVLPVIALGALAASAFSIANHLPDRGRTQPMAVPPRSPVVADVEHPRTMVAGRDQIGALGVVEAASEEVAIGTHLAGVVQQVFVAAGAAVRRGDPLFVVDDRQARADLAVRERDLAVAQARLAELRGSVPPARARVDAAAAAVQRAAAELDDRRNQVAIADSLIDQRAMAREAADSRRFAAAAAAAALADAKAHLAEAGAQLALLVTADGDGPSIVAQGAVVEQTAAAVAQARVALELHTVRAPLDAAVLQVRLRAGEYVAAAAGGRAVMVLGDTTQLHVRAEFDESEIGRFGIGDAAVATIRGRPDERIPLTLVRVEPLVVGKRTLSSSVDERVDTRVLQIVYTLAASGQQVFPGQQVDVYVAGARASAR